MTNMTVISSEIASEFIQSSNFIPIELWLVFTVLGLGFLCISILWPNRGGLVTGLVALGLLAYTMVTSFIIADLELMVWPSGDGDMLMTIYTVIMPTGLPYLMSTFFLIAILNVILGVLNFMRESAKTPTTNKYLEGLR